MAGYLIMEMFGLVCPLNWYYVPKGIAQLKVIFLNWSAMLVPFLIRSALWWGVATWTLLLPCFLSQITAIHFHHHYIFLIYHVFLSKWHFISYPKIGAKLIWGKTRSARDGNIQAFKFIQPVTWSLSLNPNSSSAFLCCYVVYTDALHTKFTAVAQCAHMVKTLKYFSCSPFLWQIKGYANFNYRVN